MSFDVFISYSREDHEWVRRLAESLHGAGLEVFLDEWEVLPGDVLVHGLERGLLGSRNGVLVVSRGAMASPWVREEYGAMAAAAIAGRHQLVAVLLDEAELPPFLASRLWVNFQGVDGPEYERRVKQLVAALREERPRRPRLDLRPDTGYLAEGALRRTLRINADEVVLLEDGEAVATHRPRGLARRDEKRLLELERARRRGPRVAGGAAPEPADSVLQGALLEAGAALGRAFLVGAAGAALREVVGQVEGSNRTLELGLELTEHLADLPWETLRLPLPDDELASPLVLHPRVDVYRSVPGLGAVATTQVRGPLRMLVAIGAPETYANPGEALDIEAELALILDAVEAARGEGRAYVRILNRGTVSAIRHALEAERFHVLHISCQARRGLLVLEDEHGEADLVDARRFAWEVLPAGLGVPSLVVLSGSSTGLSEGQEGSAALPGLARGLLAQGVPAVLAMNAPVSDAYVRRLAAQIYHGLATSELPAVLTAVSEARRRLEVVRRHEPAESQRALAEWATPTLMQRGLSQPLYDPEEGADDVKEVAEHQLQEDIVVRAVGEFVGRRREQRILLKALRGVSTGVVLHGLGGVGKSTLAAQLVSELADETALIVPMTGESSVDQVIVEVGRRLFGYCVDRQLPANHIYRELSQVLRNPQLEWRKRLGYLGQLLLGRVRILLLLDDFEANLEQDDAGRGWHVGDAELASLLETWIGNPGRSRLIVTSRYPFVLPGGSESKLEFHHLGPLSLAETRKLMWRLPGLDALGKEEQQRAYADVGGHPRTLEYLDALLRGGQARFEDVAEQMERALSAKGLPQPRAWMRESAGDLDQALAETVTLAVDDVLLGELLGRLESLPQARRLLLGASVYRLPVDRVGLAWQVGEESAVPADPALEERRARFDRARAAAAAEGRSTALGELGLEPELVRQIQDDRQQALQPPLRIPEGFGEGLMALQELGLVAPVALDEEESEEPRYAVHRWTAGALAGMSAAEELSEAHQRAAHYWLWRVQVWPQGKERDVLELIEARHHLHATGDLEEALAVTGAVMEQLDTWGAWGWEERLCVETLGWLPERSGQAASYQHHLGIVAQHRGDYQAALDWYRRSLTIFEELGDQAGMARSFGQLGMVAQQQGDYRAALDWYLRSLAISEGLGDRAGMARGYHQLGRVAQDLGEYLAAIGWYQHSLAIFEELGDRVGMARSYAEMGVLTQVRGDHEAALDWYRRALAIAEELGDRAAMASTYHQLGLVAQERGDDQAALDWYRRSLVIREELGDRASMARSYHQLGIVAQQRGDHEAALDWYLRSLAISEELGDRAGMASSYHQLGNLAQLRGDYEAALDWYQRAIGILEELGDRAGMASTTSQIGVLLTETAQVADAVPYNLATLSLRLEMGLPEAGIDIHWLGRQKALLGERSFRELLRNNLDEQSINNLMQLLNQQESQPPSV